MTSSTNLDRLASRRVRARERALRVALRVMKAEGLSVSKIVVVGAQLEIICASHDEAAVVEDEGPEDW
ncbi:hypothetical protein AB3G45_10555 [Shinella sp. S4-D37]|uniref:hypothetical protein n=1 Tax=Shinella sp. S4-D37 TaxID=3161999 RepID=UPI003465A608